MTIEHPKARGLFHNPAFSMVLCKFFATPVPLYPTRTSCCAGVLTATNALPIIIRIIIARVFIDYASANWSALNAENAALLRLTV